jgi:hypothetical protein
MGADTPRQVMKTVIMDPPVAAAFDSDTMGDIQERLDPISVSFALTATLS